MKSIFDAHCHFRQGEMSKVIIPYSSRCCHAVIAMPNTDPPLHYLDQIVDMQKYYQSLAGPNTKIFMTAKLLPHTTTKDVKTIASRKDIILGYKLYPAGVTSNSDDGIPSNWINSPPDKFLKVIEEIQNQNLVLLHHGEHPDSFCLRREFDYIPFLQLIRNYFPNLRMTLEHITTMEGIDFVNRNSNVLGTITLHHLIYILDDLIGSLLQSHLFCKPVFKFPEDRNALIETVRINNPKFGFGSDSAPWTYYKKVEGCAGVFSSPVLAEGLLSLFPDLSTLDNFTSGNATNFYNLDNSILTRDLNLVQEEYIVPHAIDCNFTTIQPLLYGQKMKWKLKE